MFQTIFLYAIISSLTGEPETFYFNGKVFPNHVECTYFYYTYESNIKNGILEHATQKFNSDAALVHEIGCVTREVDQFYNEIYKNKRALYSR